ncbi:MAG: membrane dipeptidase [Pedobacter sp.]|nr:MAG: membrane dipeptidase [Pedobacter sp.]
MSGNYKLGLAEGEWTNAKGKISYFKNGIQIPKPKYKSIHFNATLIDTHGDILYNQIKSGIDIGVMQKTGHFDLERAKKGGLDVQVFSVWSDASGGYNIAKQQIDSLFSLIQRYPDKISFVKTGRDLEAVVKSNKMAAMFGVEGGHMIEDDLTKLKSLADRGMIYLTLTWNNSTAWASSAADEASGKVSADRAGLSDFGKQVIVKLNELGVIIDLSHVGEKTFYDVLKITTKPVILSHSSVYALNPVPRNVKDDQIKALAKNNGLISLNLYNGFLDSTYRKNTQMFLDKYAEEFKSLSQRLGRGDAIDTLISRYPVEAEAIRAPIELAIDHIDHIVKLVGVNHVGLGADFDGAESFPQGLNSVADYPLFTEALVKRGYKASDIEKILGLNFIRVLKANKGE